ncbi:GNAT family N-acetyltransferase [Catenulispora pinisilvae]|uniref:GNAT family N-acetyltransferase n=1 Tax=Catenulispora pinisilvae TaxID=2705253 RepID=UPI001890CB69|nr:hypothetical protein [Catenulispora pinisilvae]
MTITIRDIDPADPATVATLLPLLQAGMAADSPLQPEPTADYLRALIAPHADWHVACLAAYDGDQPVGYGRLNHDAAVNPDLLYGDMWIAVQDRVEVTTPMLEAYLDLVRSRGATRLLLDTSEYSGYEPLYAAAGGRVLGADRRRQLDLTTIDRDQYAKWAGPSEKNAHYRVEIWQTPTPEHLLAPLVEASEAMRDAPHGALVFDHPPPDVDRRRRTEAESLAAGTRMHIAAALTADGTIAGFHVVDVFPDFRMADIGNTGVPAEFRGHGLGLRLKAALTLHLLEHEPHVDLLSTWNNVDNAPMGRVNEALGFEIAEAWSSWQFEV